MDRDELKEVLYEMYKVREELRGMKELLQDVAMSLKLLALHFCRTEIEEVIESGSKKD